MCQTYKYININTLKFISKKNLFDIEDINFNIKEIHKRKTVQNISLCRVLSGFLCAFYSIK